MIVNRCLLQGEDGLGCKNTVFLNALHAPQRIGRGKLLRQKGWGGEGLLRWLMGNWV